VIGVNFLWHMHQPDYRPAAGGPAILPWVRLHAVRGYLDLATVLEQHPAAHCVVNFSGILLDQLLSSSGDRRDYFAQLSMRDPADFSGDEVQFVLDNFFSANVETLIKPAPRYFELYQQRESQAEFSAADLRDVLVWFNLAWIGFTGRRRPDVVALMRKGRDYSQEDQLQVLSIHDELVAQVLPLYRSLAEAGTIELSFTPYHHPILPLLHDLGEGTLVEGDPLPQFSWAGDAAVQVARGMQWYSQAFGKPPLGAWPAEGSVSDAALTTLAEAGVRWAATDQQNLPVDGLAHLQPWRWSRDGHEVLVFFRDTRIADKIGFDYARWDAREAVTDLVGNIHALGRQAALEWPVVSIILDGENPWEAYPNGGEAFLHELFTQLAAHPELECVTPSLLLDKQWPRLEHIHAGSWIGGNFDIWTKDVEARQAWRLLAKARADVGTQLAASVHPDSSTADAANSVPTVLSDIHDHLLAAEGSDWFWWYGDTFSSDQKPQFDVLFRGHLIRAYELAGMDVPDEMYRPILSAREVVKEPVTPIIAAPTIDGKQTDYFEWRGATRVTSSAGQSAMATTAANAIRALDYGFSELGLCLRLELSDELMQQLSQSDPKLRICFKQNEVSKCLKLRVAPGLRRGSRTIVAVRSSIELAINTSTLDLTPGKVSLTLEVLRDSQRLRYPATGWIAIQIPEQPHLSDWIV
jgi:alpha-amylase/alpha-mannosidase (GH57 family)